MSNYIAIVKPSVYNGKGAKEDVNGNLPILLNVQFGVLPYEHIINGSISKNVGLTTDKCYLISATLEERSNPADGLMRKQLQVTNLGEISALDIATKRREFIDSMGLGRVEPKVEAGDPKVTEEPEMSHVDEDGDPLNGKK